MSKDHYVPKLVLKNFSKETGNYGVNSNYEWELLNVKSIKKISVYDVKNRKLLQNRPIEKLYTEEQFYPDDIESKLNKKVEREFSKLLDSYLLKEKFEIKLKRKDVLLVKKFLLVSIIRTPSELEWIESEKNFYKNLEDPKKVKEMLIQQNTFWSDEEIYNFCQCNKPPFNEKEIEGETLSDYWFRTLDVILESDGTPESILKQENKTYMAYRWSKVINAGFLAFWDSDSINDEFVITDIGMTSENEKGSNSCNFANPLKINSLISSLKSLEDFKEMLIKPSSHINVIINNLRQQIEFVKYFHENFQMFPISKKRMIVLISPYFRILEESKSFPFLNLKKLEELSYLNNKNLFMPNSVKYIHEQLNRDSIEKHDDDEYMYEIKKLNSHEVRYCNSLFFDRVKNFLGFSSLEKIAGSVIKYKMLNKNFACTRFDYSVLYSLIKNKYNK